jgi:hypothetical protein
MRSGVSVKLCDDAVIANMKNKRYHAALVILKQIGTENSGLSYANQVRYIQCLYHVKRYRAAHEKGRQFAESGNTLPELSFMRGLCAYALGQWQTAHEYFHQRREWLRWAKKAELRRDQTSAMVIRIGEMPTKAEDEKTVPQVVQTPRSVEIALPLAGIDPNDLRVTAGDLWIDFVYDDGQRKVNRSWELFDKVVPKSLSFEVTPMVVTIKVDKAVEADWPSVTRPENASIIPDLSAEVMKQLEIPEYTDAKASEMFEHAMALAKEEAVDISSWFVD